MSSALWDQGPMHSTRDAKRRPALGVMGSPGQRVSHDLQKAMAREGLGQERSRPEAFRPAARRRRGMPGDEHHGELTLGEYPLTELETGKARQLHVQDQA